MRFLVDLIYAVAAIVSAPVWLIRMIITGKIRTDWRGRFGKTTELPPSQQPRVLVHAVSVGEVNAIRKFVTDLASSQPEIEVVIASTTDTGFARAKELWQGSHVVVRYPFDFSRSVRRFLRSIKPSLVVLTELEVWPNFTAECERLGVPIVVINGRLTSRSFRRYRKVRWLVSPSFQRLTAVAAQNQTYANRFASLGTKPERVRVTGTMKWDTALIADEVPGAETLAHELGIDRTRPLIVAGSTAPDEHQLLHNAIPEGVQLLCAPRKPEWFAQAARDLPNCARRSRNDGVNRMTNRFLLDTIGELRKAYALADLVIIGRSFGALHGSDMIEPIALGKATIVGPSVTDFQDVVDSFLDHDAMVQTTAANLKAVIADLMHDHPRRQRLACNGREVIRAHQGATERNLKIIYDIIARIAATKTPPSRR